MGLIYMRISPSGGKYIGKTVKRENERWDNHVYEAYNINDINYNSLLNKAIRKYGAENFSVQILEDNISNENIAVSPVRPFSFRNQQCDHDQRAPY